MGGEGQARHTVTLFPLPNKCSSGDEEGVIILAIIYKVDCLGNNNPAAALIGQLSPVMFRIGSERCGKRKEAKGTEYKWWGRKISFASGNSIRFSLLVHTDMQHIDTTGQIIVILHICEWQKMSKQSSRQRGVEILTRLSFVLMGRMEIL